MAISFKCDMWPMNELQCESIVEDGTSYVYVSAICNVDETSRHVFLDINTAIHLRKHLGREIAKAKEVKNG